MAKTKKPKKPSQPKAETPEAEQFLDMAKRIISSPKPDTKRPKQ